MDILELERDHAAAIDFALDYTGGDGLNFLRSWRDGDWETIRRNYPEFNLSGTYVDFHELALDNIVDHLLSSADSAIDQIADALSIGNALENLVSLLMSKKYLENAINTATKEKNTLHITKDDFDLIKKKLRVSIILMS